MSRKISYSAAINEALIQMMEEDPRRGVPFCLLKPEPFPS